MHPFNVFLLYVQSLQYIRAKTTKIYVPTTSSDAVAAYLFIDNANEPV